MHRARMLASRPQQQAALESAHGRGTGGLHGHAHDVTGVCVDAGRNVHRQHRNRRGIQDIDQFGDFPLDRGRNARSEHRIADPVRATVQQIDELVAAAEQAHA